MLQWCSGKERIGLALGGGVQEARHIGVLMYLREKGFPLILLWNQYRALVGGAYASASAQMNYERG